MIFLVVSSASSSSTAKWSVQPLTLYMQKDYQYRVTMKSSHQDHNIITYLTNISKDCILHYKKICKNPKCEGNCNIRRNAREAIQFSPFKNKQWLGVWAFAEFTLKIEHSGSHLGPRARSKSFPVLLSSIKPG